MSNGARKTCVITELIRGVLHIFPFKRNAVCVLI